MATAPQPIRRKNLIDSLALDRPGLKISPLFRPTALKAEHNVFYTDYTSANESRKKHANYEHDEIMDIDFIWTPGKQLVDCVPAGMNFHWAIASHVLEHIPDPIGWLLQVFEVLEPGAVFSMALPDKRYCYDIFRRETDAADLVDSWIRGFVDSWIRGFVDSWIRGFVDSWIRGQTIPGPRQIFDFLSRSVDGSGEDGQRAFEISEHFEDAARTYTNAQALEFAMNSWQQEIILIYTVLFLRLKVLLLFFRKSAKLVF